jgi:hypothetical protein
MVVLFLLLCMLHFVDAAAPPADERILGEYGASLAPPAAAHAEFVLLPVGSDNSIAAQHQTIADEVL